MMDDITKLTLSKQLVYETSIPTMKTYMVFSKATGLVRAIYKVSSNQIAAQLGPGEDFVEGRVDTTMHKIDPATKQAVALAPAT